MDQSTVIINGEKVELRDYDLTMYLGINAYYRLKGYKTWTPTDTHGRAALVPGMSYDVMICPEGSWPASSLTIMERIYRFLSLLF